MSIAAMETAPAQPFDGFVGQDRTIVRQNPHAERHAYMPGVYFAQANVRTTGYTFFPQGRLITFRTLPVGGHYNSAWVGDKTAPPAQQIEITAEQAAINAETEYGVAEGIDAGFVSLDMLLGEGLAKDYFDALHPQFSIFGHQCPAGLEVCPTCRKQWLESEASKDYFNQRGLGLDRSVAEKVKLALYDSVSRYAAFCDEQWGQLIDKHQQSRNGDKPFVLNPSHKHYGRCVHDLASLSIMDRQTIPTQAALPTGAAPDPTAGMSAQERADYWQFMAEQERKRNAAKAPSVQVAIPDSVQTVTEAGGTPIEITSDGPDTVDIAEAINVGATVIVRGATIGKVVAKPFGKYKVEYEGGETEMVTREDIQEQNNEQEIQPSAE